MRLENVSRMRMHRERRTGAYFGTFTPRSLDYVRAKDARTSLGMTASRFCVAQAGGKHWELAALENDAFDDVGDVFALVDGGFDDFEDFLPLVDIDRMNTSLNSSNHLLY